MPRCRECRARSPDAPSPTPPPPPRSVTPTRKSDIGVAPNGLSGCAATAGPGWQSVTFTRPLAAAGADSNPVSLAAPQRLIWAVGSTRGLNQHDPTGAGQVTITL